MGALADSRLPEEKKLSRKTKRKRSRRKTQPSPWELCAPRPRTARRGRRSGGTETTNYSNFTTTKKKILARSPLDKIPIQRRCPHRRGALDREDTVATDAVMISLEIKGRFSILSSMWFGRGQIVLDLAAASPPPTKPPPVSGIRSSRDYSTRPVAEKSMPTLRRIMSTVAIVLSDSSSVR